MGKFCPSLTNLSVSLSFCLTKKHLLGLILLGEVSDILFPIDNEGWSKDSVLAGLQVPSEIINPLCLTLQELNVVTGSDCFIRLGEDGQCNSIMFRKSSLSASTFAFFLRQLPKLKKIKLDAHVPLTEVFQILYAAKVIENHEQRIAFERNCRNAAIQTDENLIITSPIPFSGKYDTNLFIGSSLYLVVLFGLFSIL